MDMHTKIWSVLLVEDDPSCRDRLIHAIEIRDDLSLLNAVGSIEEAISLMSQEHPDVIAVDIGLPDGSGLDLIRACKKQCHNTLCLVITMYADESHVLEAFAAGANGYLLKDAPLSDLAEGIISMIGGGVPISPAIASALLTHLRPPVTQEMFDSEVHLSPREMEVLDFLARGNTRSEIADSLNLSINTISIYIKSVYRKLQVNSGKKAVFEARRQGLL
jgi:DNA-binding NarL/FixJ family response regulator